MEVVGFDFTLFWAAAAVGMGGDLVINHYHDLRARGIVIATWVAIAAAMGALVPFAETTTAAALTAVACPAVGRAVGSALVYQRLRALARVQLEETMRRSRERREVWVAAHVNGSGVEDGNTA